MKHVISIAAFLFAVATAASAQIAETMEVRVTNVDVVVTDRSGKVVTGLTKDDFQILENGFEQYCSLGYRPPSGMGDRTLKVKMKKPGLTARARRGYTLRTAEEELGDRVVANAFNPRMSSDMPVTV